MPPKGSGKGKGKMKAKQEPETQPRKKARKSTENEEEEPAPPKKGGNLPKAEAEAKINGLVRYLLFASTNARPVKVDALAKEVLLNVSEHHYYELIQAASRKLEKVFGLTLVLLPPADTGPIAEKLYDSDDQGSGDEASQAQTQGKGKGKKEKRGGQRERYRKSDVLVVLNCVKKRLREAEEFAVRKEEWWGVGMTILGLVYISGMEVNETLLAKFLGDLGVDWAKAKHPELKCSASSIVTELVAQKYLYKKQGEQSGGDRRVPLYRWGPRAKAEISEADVIGFLADVYGQSLDTWADMLNRPIKGSIEDEEDEGTEL